MRRSAPLLRVAALAPLALALCTCGGGKPGRTAPAPSRERVVAEVEARAIRRPPVLFIGLDGADWSMLDPLIASGRMPELGRLVAQGRRFVLETEHPPLSPLLWTTMMTGVSPLEHGILDFSRFRPEDGEREPISGDERRVPALWDLATWAGKSVAVLGLWATHPAEPVDGLMVSDRFFGFLNVESAPPAGAVFPAARTAWAQAILARAEREVGLEEMRRFLPDLTAAELAEHATSTRAYDHPVSALRRILIETRAYDELAHAWLDEQTPDLTILYFEGTDSIGHVFAPFAAPRQPAVSPDDFARYRDVGPAYFEEIDRRLGAWRRWAEAHGAVLVLASDHGFAWSEGRPGRLSSVDNATAAKWHREQGIALFDGPGIAPGTEPRPGAIRQVAATLAAFAGLPPGRDLAGPQLLAADPAAGGEPLDYQRWFAPRHGTPSATATRGQEGGGEEELAKLRALGYLGAGETSRRAATAGNSTRTGGSFNNEGLILRSLGRDAEAARAYQQALAIDPGLVSATWNLSQLRFEQGDLAAADDLLARALAEGLADGEHVAIERALAYQRRGDPGRAIALLDRASAALPRAGRLLLFRGRFRIDQRDCAGALADFESAERLDPRDPAPPASAGVALLCLGRPDEARASLRRSLTLDPDQAPVAAFLARLESAPPR